MIKQADPDYGCIPACAREAITRLGLSPPSEAALISAMYSSPAPGLTGFNRFEGALSQLGVAVRVVYGQGPDLLSQVQGLLAAHSMAFVPTNAGSLHCRIVTAARPDSNNQVEFEVHDPDPKVVDPQWQPASTLASVWTRDTISLALPTILTALGGSHARADQSGVPGSSGI